MTLSSETEDWGWVCWLKRARRGFAAASREVRSLLASGDSSAASGRLWYIFRSEPESDTAALRPAKANIWSHATKNSRPANRRVDLLPYDAAFFASFFSLPPSLSLFLFLFVS